MEVLVKKSNKIDIELAKGLLENNHIPCLVKTEHGEGFVLRAGGMLEEYFLYVKPEDAKTAKAICDAYFDA
ncbi:MAG: DUF2007 domain-containing protein [Gallicola sp.]|nr:DUF2007 domain-containing protein [Gallicola sp.]